ncbi:MULTISPECIES: thioredoxin domain-containing protein [Peptoniphilus]|uniref:thioredoxin domain-containing protein n=1 Tax=Peptoniphilus TaxID=162289 RepID=UPI0002FC87E5|nr:MULTISPECIES: thioredoxin domain-containing protein [Peptoniphilus]
MNRINKSKIFLSYAYGILIILIAYNIYLNGYLRDYSIYNLKLFYRLNLLIFPSIILLYLFLKYNYKKLKLILCLLFVFLFFLNLSIFNQAKKEIIEYEYGTINSLKLIRLNKSYVGKIYFYRDDCPACKNLTEKIKVYNKKREEKILMYNTNSDLKNKNKIIKKYNISTVPTVVNIDKYGNVKDITAEIIKSILSI